MKKKFGFTLAEVLITLGIIGVVAAMTIPTLIQNTNSVKFSSQFKKTLSTLNNAAEMAQAHYDASFATLTENCNTPRTESIDTMAATKRNSICGLINATLSNVRYVNTANNAYTAANGMVGTAPTWGTGAGGVGAPNTAHIYALADGSWVAVPAAMTNAAANTTCTVQPGTDPATLNDACHGFIDVNGLAAPNRATRCASATVAANNSGQNAQTLCANMRSTDINDIFPIVFHDGAVSPSSTAARAVLSR